MSRSGSSFLVVKATFAIYLSATQAFPFYIPSFFGLLLGRGKKAHLSVMFG
jgi:hypothetical protein